MANKAGNTTLELESPLGVFSFIFKVYLQFLVQIGHLTHTLTQGVKIIADFAEYLLISIEGEGSAGVTGFADHRHLSLRYTLLIFLLVHLTIAPDTNAAPGGESVYYRSTHAM